VAPNLTARKTSVGARHCFRLKTRVLTAKKRC
jgi:hypothetical protein